MNTTEWLWKRGPFLPYLLLPFRLLLSLLLHMLNWLLAPVLLLGRIVGQISILPIRLLAQFEVRLDPSQIARLARRSIYIAKTDHLHILWCGHSSRRYLWDWSASGRALQRASLRH